MNQHVTLRPVKLVWKPGMGQQTQATAPAQQPNVPAPSATVPSATGQEKPAFIDSAFMAFVTDLIAVTGAGAVCYAFDAAKHTGKAVFFGILSGAMGIKAIVDWNWVRER